MFAPNLKEITNFNVSNIGQFVEFWSQFTNIRVCVHNTDIPIDYFAELNIGNDLTEENIRRLVRWKDPLRLTHLVMTNSDNGRSNPKVDRILENINSLNDFRRGVLTEDAIKNVVAKIFPHGVVYQIFLLHIAKPHLYPIADQHVFRSYSTHKQAEKEIAWATYAGYRSYFSELAGELEVKEIPDNILRLKEIDNALMAFGKFLKMLQK